MKNSRRFDFIVNETAEYADVRAEDMKELSIEFSEELYEVSFYTDWMYYVCYVDECGRIVGFLTEPVVQEPDSREATHICGRCA